MAATLWMRLFPYGNARHMIQLGFDFLVKGVIKPSCIQKVVGQVFCTLAPVGAKSGSVNLLLARFKINHRCKTTD